jgi:hypothetical protein
VARALKPGGRFVAELGGKGNIAHIELAVETVAVRYHPSLPPRRTFYPSMAEYATLLEASGLEMWAAFLFNRPTPLEGEQGMENWLRQFKWFYFETLPPSQAEQALQETIAALREPLYRQGQWRADYRRLRFLAAKVRPETEE